MWVVFEVLFEVLPSAVPPDETEAVFARSVPSATPAPTVTWIVKLVVPLTARVTEREQVTTWPTAEQSVLGWNVVAAGRVSVAVTLPVWTEGPLFVTTKP